MTVLDQVLQAEAESKTAIEAAKETAQRTIAAAEAAKQSKIDAAKAEVEAAASAARSAAEAEIETETTQILTTAKKEAEDIRSAITAKKASLVDVITSAVKSS